MISTTVGKFYSLTKGPTEGAPVVFTHGTAAWSGLWLPTLEHVASHRYRAIGYDMTPFGFSGRSKDSDYSRQSQARRFLAFLKTIGKKPIVVAHSFSGGMVAEAAMIEPDAFAGVIFVNAAIGLNSHLNPASPPPAPTLSDRAGICGFSNYLKPVFI